MDTIGRRQAFHEAQATFSAIWGPWLHKLMMTSVPKLLIRNGEVITVGVTSFDSTLHWLCENGHRPFDRLEYSEPFLARYPKLRPQD